MNSITWAFDVLSMGVITMAIWAVLGNNPIRSAFLMVGCFVLAGINWLLMQAEFLGLALIFVYVGAVMTLFLFVILMVNAQKQQRSTKQIMMLVAMFVTLMALVVVVYSVQFPLWQSVGAGQPVSVMDNVVAIGSVLYTDYCLVFQAAGLLLLAAIVAAIGLVHQPKDTRIKRQKIAAQIQRDSKTVIRTVAKIQKGQA